MTHQPYGPVLALDTSGSACAVALWRAGSVLARRDVTMTHGHAEALAPLTRETLLAAGLTMPEVSLIAVTLGPGSFTGLRVGLAFARGLGLAIGVPVLGLPGPMVLAAMARTARPPTADESVVVVLDARRAEVFVQAFAPDGAAMAPVVSLPPEAVASHLPPRGPVLLTGDGVPLLPPEVVETPHLTVADAATRPPDPAVLAALVTSHPDAALPPSPVYGRAPDATPPPPNPRAAATPTPSAPPAAP